MVHLLLLFVFSIHQEDPLAQGLLLKSEGRLFQAESFFLQVDPTSEQIPVVARALGEISLQMRNVPERREFYRTYLTRSKQWRGVAALALAGLALHERDFDDFANNSTIFLNEYSSPNQERFRLLYHLARYTHVTAEQLTLSDDEKAWYQSLLDLEKHYRFPKHHLGSQPDVLSKYWMLERNYNDELGEEPEADEARYFHLLLRLNQALIRGNDSEAARVINTIAPLDETLQRADLTLLYYPLLARFFERRDMAPQAHVTLENLKQIKQWAFLPLEYLPDHLVERKVEVEKPPPEEPVVEEPVVEKEPPAEPVDQQEEVVDQSEVSDLFSLERRLLAGESGLELALRKLPTDTTYRKIYRNYLLGLHFVLRKRDDDALTRLRVAEQQVATLPFPSLEAKVWLALGLYYEQSGNREKAAWYRVQALQVWQDSKHLPALMERQEQPAFSPISLLIDEIIPVAGEQDMVSKVLYYSELERFVLLMRRAYLRNTLSANPVLGSQLRLVGKQLARQIENLAENPDHQPNPKRYNDTLELWHQLWQQSLGYYQEQQLPTVEGLQRALNTHDRIVSFVEGEKNLGVLLISKTQAFGLPLGDKRAFMALNDDERMGFLAGRLGPIWNQQGRLILCFSDTYRKTSLLHSLRAKVTGDRLKLVFSLKSFLAPKSASECRRIALFTDHSMALPANDGPVDIFSLTNLKRGEFETSLSHHDHLVYRGPVEVSAEGLHFGGAENALFFHEIVHYNANLCSMTLLIDDLSRWGAILDELELINPSAGTSIFLSDGAFSWDQIKQDQRGFGVRFP